MRCLLMSDTSITGNSLVYLTLQGAECSALESCALCGFAYSLFFIFSALFAISSASRRR